jgi:hypothetical protein
MPTRHPSRGKLLRHAFLALALVLPAGAALATEPTAADVSDFEHLIGVDWLIASLPASLAKDAQDHHLAPATRDCQVRQTAAALTAQIHAGVAQRITHEDVEQWRAFAASGPGGKFFAFLRDGMAAGAEGRTPPVMATFKAGLTMEETKAIEAFVQSPAGGVMQGLRTLTGGFDDKAILQQVARECGVTP